jgi:transposase
MQRLSIPNYTVEDIEGLLESNPDYIIGMRLMALIQIKKGMSSRQLEAFYYKSHARYCVWVNNFNANGLEGLANKPKSGRKPLLTVQQKESLADVLRSNRPDDLGFNSATWNGPLVCDYIKAAYGVEYKRAQVYNILKELGFTVQKARGKYPEVDNA